MKRNDPVSIFILEKLYRNRIIDAKHISFEDLVTGSPKHVRGDIKKKLQKLEKLGLIVNTRTVGNATMYQFNAESNEAQHIDRLINAIATRRIDETLDSKKKIAIKPKVTSRSKKK